MKIFINKFINFINENYKGDFHNAPTKENGDAPLYNLTDVYPDDIYSNKGARMYGDYGGDIRDMRIINILNSAKGKPNYPIKIYRAVPDINYELKQKIKPLLDVYNYYIRWKFFPMKNDIVHNLEDKYEDYSYDEQQQLILKDLDNQITELQQQLKKPLKINDGDWVTIDREYAKEHGENNLNNKYKIISKTVKAKNLYSEGNSIYEWGYSE